MNEKMITITRTLTEEEARTYLNECHEASKQANSKTGFYQLMEFYKLIKQQTALSDRELFIEVMTQKWKPGEYDDFDTTYEWYCVYNDGRIHRYTFDYKIANKEEVAGVAPTKELAEKLSEVITGRYRPVKGDILYSLKRDSLKPMSRYDGQAMEENCGDILFETYAYFFTSSQRDSFARQQEEKREPEKEFEIALIREEPNFINSNAGHFTNAVYAGKLKVTINPDGFLKLK